MLLKGDGEPPKIGVAQAGNIATIADVSTETRTVKVFNLEVANAHTYFVGKNGVVVHNAKSGTSGNSSVAIAGKAFDKLPYSEGYLSQIDIGGGMRVDGINYGTGHIIERKCTGRWQTVRNGQRRTIDYVAQMNKTHPRPGGWFADLDILNPITGNRTTIPAAR